MRKEVMEKGRADVVAAYLGMVVNRVVDRSTSLCRWNLQGEKAESPFVRDRLAMLWDFAEVHPFGGISGDFTSAIDSVCKVIRHCARIDHPADLRRGTATDLPYDDATFDAAIVDPPYYDNISYANSSDFYYVWLKRSIGHLFPEHFAGPVAPKRQEIVAAAYKHNRDRQVAAREYEQLMTEALRELQRVLKPAGSLVVVYAHQTTAGWSTLIGSLRAAGFTVVEAWPLDTERAQRRGGTDNASLASSIFLVALRRESDETGDWSKVQEEFEAVIAERIGDLAEMGITGADLVIASIGAGLRPYTAYGRVELPNGDPLEPEAFLDEVQTTVVKTILSDLMGVSRSGVEAVDPVTQLYVIGRFEYGDSAVPFDEMNTLVHGVLAGARGGGVELLGPRGLTAGAAALVEQQKDTMRLRDFEDRGHVDGLGQAQAGSPNLIDVLHRILWLAEHQPGKVGEYLLQAPPDLGRLHLVAHALSGSGLSGKGIGTSEREQHAIQRLLASWKHLVEDNLFRREP
jgi:putative DNA methylase